MAEFAAGYITLIMILIMIITAVLITCGVLILAIKIWQKIDNA